MCRVIKIEILTLGIHIEIVLTLGNRVYSCISLNPRKEALPLGSHASEPDLKEMSQLFGT